MKIKLYNYFLPLLLLLGRIGYLKGQDAVPLNNAHIISGTVVDSLGQGVPFATVVYGEGKRTTSTDTKGFFSLKVKENDVLTIKAAGYRTLTIEEAMLGKENLVLSKLPQDMGEEDIINIPFGSLYKRRLVGAVSIIKGTDIESIPDPSLTNSLAGKAAGLTVMQTAGTPGWNSANMYVRGINSSADLTPMIVVDGIERPMNDLNAEEIESIQILKDATSKIIYGARGANGVIMVTTKRGKVNTRNRRISVETGVKEPELLPKFLNASDYATLFNEARRNDSLTDYYSADDIMGYKNGNANSLRYPNVDFYGELLKKNMPYRNVVAQFQGGNDKAQYYLNMGYLGEGGLEKVGPQTTFNRLNIRANLNYSISKYVSMYLDAVGRMEFRNANNLSSQDFFGRMSSHRPNEYPLIIRSTPDSVIYGGSYYSSGNVYAQMVEGGFSHRTDRTGQTNIGVDIRLDNLTPGLTFKSYVTFDVYNYVTYGKSQNFYSFVPVAGKTLSGADTVSLVQLTTGTKVSDQSRWGDDGYRNLGYTFQFNYKRIFQDLHAFNSDLLFFRNKRELNGYAQDIKNQTWAWRTNYSYKNKLMGELDLTELGSTKFAPSKRYGFFPAFGAGWVLSEEDFVKRIIGSNYLKLKATYGILGTDRNIDFYQFENRWYYSGNANFGANNENRPGVTNIATIGNPNVSWEKSKELNIGLEATFLQRALSMEINYFRNDRYDILSNRSNSYPRILGGLLPVENFGRVLNQGIDADINYRTQIGKLSVDVAANFVYSKAINKQYDDLKNFPDYRKRVNTAVDGMFGYVAEGLFQNIQEIQSSPLQFLGPVAPGDIRYKDLNGDNIIDQKDVQIIGHSFPRITYGINIGLKYERFGLLVNGSGIGDVDVSNNNSYFWINDLNRKYSDVVWNRWTPQTAATATYPRLTTLRGTNNYQNSTFWQRDASFFRIKSAELSYTFDKAQIDFVNQAKLFVRGNNLLLITKYKYLDVEDQSAGLTNFPIFRTFTAGVVVSF